MSEKLLPCPYCGADDQQLEIAETTGAHQQPYFSSFCNLCESYGPAALTADEAVKLHNIRKTGEEYLREEYAQDDWNRYDRYDDSTWPEEGTMVWITIRGKDRFVTRLSVFSDELFNIPDNTTTKIFDRMHVTAWMLADIPQPWRG